MTMPYMPDAMWCSVGVVPQWYMYTPAWVAVNSYIRSSPGLIERISSFQATIEAWKSIECGSLFVSGLTRWTRSVSPTFTRMTGAGTVSPKVHTIWTMPGATVISRSVITSSMSWTSPSRIGGAAGSWSTYSGASGSGWTSAFWPGTKPDPEWPTRSGLPPATVIAPVMPASA